jgi:hypothetical protein
LDGDGNPYRAISTYSLDVSEKFHSELGVRRGEDGSYPPYSPILPHEWPKEYVQERIYKTEAALVEYPNRMYAVTEPLRAIIERLEPGVHQFNPIRVILPKGLEHTVPHHMMIVGRWLNAFSQADSDPRGLHSANTVSPVVYDNKKSFAGVAMSATIMGNAHLWRESALRGGTFYISDQLKDEVTKAGLRLPPSFKMKTVCRRASPFRHFLAPRLQDVGIPIRFRIASLQARPKELPNKSRRNGNGSQPNGGGDRFLPDRPIFARDDHGETGDVGVAGHVLLVMGCHLAQAPDVPHRARRGGGV